MSFPSDDELELDENHDQNKVAGTVEKELTKLQTDGFNRKEINIFEGRLKGK